MAAVRPFTVTITETIVYSATFTREELADITGYYLSGMSDDEVADTVSRDPELEAAMQRYGNVQGTEWRVVPVINKGLAWVDS